MRRSHLQLIAFAACAAVGCGEPAASLDVSLSRSALMVGTVTLGTARVDLHPSSRTCADIRTSGPDVRATYSTVVNLEVGALAGRANLDGLVPGTYTLAVWGYAMANGRARAFGCVEGVDVRDGHRTSKAVQLKLYTGG